MGHVTKYYYECNSSKDKNREPLGHSKPSRNLHFGCGWSGYSNRWQSFVFAKFVYVVPVTHLKRPGAEGGSLAPRPPRVGQTGRTPGQPKPGSVPEWKSRPLRNLVLTSRPGGPYLLRMPRPPQARFPPPQFLRPHRPLRLRGGATARLRAAGGGRGGQSGRSGRKGRCGAARPREGECRALCARRPGVGAGSSSARGQPRCRGRPLEARGGQQRKMWLN